MADTRTLRNYLDSLPQGNPDQLVGQSLTTLPSVQLATAAQGAKADTALQEVVAGTSISVDATDPVRPVISTPLVGVPSGGATGQTLAKLSNADGDVGFINPPGGGDMLASVYDPQAIEADAFDRANHTGVMPVTGIDASGTADETTFLRGDGSWVSPSAGAVTSVAMTVPTGLSVAGSPITSTGTFAVTYAAGYQGYTTAEANLVASAVQPAAIADMLETSDIGSTVQAYDADTAKTDVSQQFTAPQRSEQTALTSGATITIDLADSNDFTLTLGHNATLANPTNQANQVGLKGSIAGVQDGTGSRTLSYGSNWYPIGAAAAPAIPTGANEKFRVDFHVVSSTRIDFTVAGVGV